MSDFVKCMLKCLGSKSISQLSADARKQLEIDAIDTAFKIVDECNECNKATESAQTESEPKPEIHKSNFSGLQNAAQGGGSPEGMLDFIRSFVLPVAAGQPLLASKWMRSQVKGVGGDAIDAIVEAIGKK